MGTFVIHVDGIMLGEYPTSEAAWIYAYDDLEMIKKINQDRVKVGPKAKAE